jgi:two-component system NtrC family sensor kinase
MQRVLVVDDDKLMRTLLRIALTEQGLIVDEAPNGRAALELIHERRPDLMLLDLMMPRMDGFAVLEAMKADGLLEQIQVVVLTGRSSREVLYEALESGADDYITKPFHIDEVVARAKAHLRIVAATRQLEQRRRDGEILVQIGQRLSSRLDIQSILQDVTSMVAEVLETERCSVVLLDEDDTHNARVVAASDDIGLTDRPIVLADYPEVRQVIETREPVVVSDISADPLVAAVKDQLALLEVRSAALFPLMEGERCFGVLFLRSTRPREAFADREVQFGRIAANATAVAITNARLFGALKEETDRISHARAVVEHRLRAVERYAHFFENAADAIFIVGPSGRILFVNRMAEDLVGPRATIIGKLLADAYKVDAAQLETLFERLRAGDFSHRIDLQTRDFRTLSISAARVPNDAAFNVTTREVTEQRRNEQMAAVAALAGTAAHELNQPLTSVLGYAELLKKRIHEDPLAIKAVRIIHEQAERMAQIVRRIGRITRYETKPYVGDTRIIDLDAAADPTVDISADDLGIDLTKKS